MKFTRNQTDSRVTEIYRYRDFLAPRFWPTWIAIGGLHLMAWLPWTLKVWLTHGICASAHWLLAARYQVLKTNLKLCFPELDEKARKRLEKAALFSNIFGFFEIAVAWVRGTGHIKVSIAGWEHYEKAKQHKRGILFLTGHFSILDMGAAMLGDLIDVGTIYRKHNNPLFNYFMTRCREKFVDFTLARRDVKGMIRALRNGKNLGYIPDQDFGRKRSIFVPFFGVQTATITMTSQLAEAGDAIVLPISGFRLSHKGDYQLQIHPPLQLPTDNHRKDTEEWTRWLEACVREYPDQYLWFHKRFKSHPPDEPPRY